MAALRVILIIASVVGAAFPVFILATEHATKAGEIVLPMMIVGFLLNLFYLYRSKPGGASIGRIGRLIGLWFDAKERELQQRAKPPHSN